MKKDVFPIVFLVFLCVSASPFHPFVVLKEYSWTHMCNTMLHGWLCQKSRRILSVSFSVMCILPRFGVIPFFSDLSSCCKCHGHVMDMSWTCMLHDACMMPACASSHDMSWHVMPSSQHPLFTIRHPTQLNWPLLVTHNSISLKSKMTLSSSGSVNFKREYLDEEAS